METKDELFKEYGEWTKKYVEADKKLKKILPPVANLTRGDKLEPWMPTRETLDEFKRLETEISIALNKRREIIEKLVHLRQPRLN